MTIELIHHTCVDGFGILKPHRSRGRRRFRHAMLRAGGRIYMR